MSGDPGKIPLVEGDGNQRLVIHADNAGHDVTISVQIFMMRTSSKWLLIHLFTEFVTLGLLALRGCQKPVDRTIIRNTGRTFPPSSIYFGRFQFGDAAIGF
jgi:hypothetical protein